MAVASVASDAATEVLMPGSEDEAIAAFGDGADVVVVGGGTIVVPDLTYRRLRPAKALMLGRAGLSGIEKDGSRVTIGATTPVQELVEMARRSARAPRTSPTSRSARRAPSAGTSARARATRRRAATSRARSSRSARRCARPRTATSPRSRSRTSSRKRGERLLLSVSFDEPAAGAFAGLDRPHTHDYTALAVSGARAQTGHSASPRPERARGGPAFPRPRLRPEIPLRQAKQRCRTSRRTTTRSPRPGTARRCSRCSCAASSPS